MGILSLILAITTFSSISDVSKQNTVLGDAVASINYIIANEILFPSNNPKYTGTMLITLVLFKE
ncbi:MAG: hypothetical protein JWP81_4639 [Ferruginibacter sp.]|nr:hypothetical protein [Ferruginibacter sp.]